MSSYFREPNFDLEVVPYSPEELDERYNWLEEEYDDTHGEDR